MKIRFLHFFYFHFKYDPAADVKSSTKLTEILKTGFIFIEYFKNEFHLHYF